MDPLPIASLIIIVCHGRFLGHVWPERVKFPPEWWIMIVHDFVIRTVMTKYVFRRNRERMERIAKDLFGQRPVSIDGPLSFETCFISNSERSLLFCSPICRIVSCQIDRWVLGNLCLWRDPSYVVKNSQIDGYIFENSDVVWRTDIIGGD